VHKTGVIKLDTQGSELDILTGAINALRGVIALEIEVEFNPIYTGQPLFADVDTFLRRHGFVLWRLEHLVHYGFSSESSHYDVSECQWFDDREVGFMAQGGQLFWGHAYYLRENVVRRPDVRTACIAYALGFTDLYRIHSASIET